MAPERLSLDRLIELATAINDWKRLPDKEDEGREMNMFDESHVSYKSIKEAYQGENKGVQMQVFYMHETDYGLLSRKRRHKYGISVISDGSLIKELVSPKVKRVFSSIQEKSGERKGLRVDRRIFRYDR